MKLAWRYHILALVMTLAAFTAAGLAIVLFYYAFQAWGSTFVLSMVVGVLAFIFDCGVVEAIQQYDEENRK